MIESLVVRPRPLAPAHPLLPVGPGSAIRTTEGTVAAMFSLTTYDKRHRVAMYALRVANESSSVLICRILAIAPNGSQALAYPATFEVEPYSLKSADVPVWLDGSVPQRFIAEVAGRDLYCTVEAPPPDVRPRRRPIGAIAAIACILSGLAMVGVAAVGLAIPRILAFAAPPLTHPGSTTQMEYSASGMGALAYSVAAPDGKTIAGATLPAASGAFPLTIPATGHPGAYSVRLSMRGPLGNVSQLRVVNVEVARNAGPQIGAISVDPVVAAPGQTVTATYTASAGDGYLRLLDRDGTVWAQKPFSHNGVTTFSIPPVSGNREMRVLLHVTKGRGSAESSAGLVIAGTLPAAAQGGNANDMPVVAGTDGAAAVSTPADAGNGTFALARARVRSGETIDVRILSPRNGMRIALADPQSHEVSAVDVGSDADAVPLRAPAVRVPSRYTIVATFTDGFGEESVVEPITIEPAR